MVGTYETLKWRKRLGAVLGNKAMEWHRKQGILKTRKWVERVGKALTRDWTKEFLTEREYRKNAQEDENVMR